MSSALLVSTYNLGQQPAVLAAVAARLHAAGWQARVWDASLDALDDETVRGIDHAVLWVPMHTALRLARRAELRLRQLVPDVSVSYFGLYAELNADVLAPAHVFGERDDERLLEHLIGQPAPAAAADRDVLPGLERYAHLSWRGEHVHVGAVETTRGCKHLCTHCPVPPVWKGRFEARSRDAVARDIDELVRRGAGHITFTDPDFLNGPRHAARITDDLHRSHPSLTFDFTAKVDHLVSHADLLVQLGRNGALFVVSAIESLNPDVLTHLAKGHTRDDVDRALGVTREAGISLRPTFVPFTPWETRRSYRELLSWLEEHELLDHLEPVQLVLRLLVPPGLLLEDHPAMVSHLTGIDREALTHLWAHPDPQMDVWQTQLNALIETEPDPLPHLWKLVGLPPPKRPTRAQPPPRLSEPWFC